MHPHLGLQYVRASWQNQMEKYPPEKYYAPFRVQVKKANRTKTERNLRFTYVS